MKKLILAIAAALMFSAPAFAQTVAVGRTTTSPNSFNYVNVDHSWEVGNDVELVAEARLTDHNQHVAKVGLQREFGNVLGVTISGRANLTQAFGKRYATGMSLEPSASFEFNKAKVTFAYEVGDTFKQKDNGEVRATKVTVMYPFDFGNFGVKLEDNRGDRRESSLALVYSLQR